MTEPRIGVYACDIVGPENIANHSDIGTVGWTDLIVSLFHISDKERYGDPDGKILFFNGHEIINDKQIKQSFVGWNNSLQALKDSGKIKKVFLSFGGGGDPRDPDHVRDFLTIKNLYTDNGGKLANTLLAQNLKLLRDLLPVADGVDMDCEETYDPDSFDAFCNLCYETGFKEITYAPFGLPILDPSKGPDSLDFWTNALNKSLDWGKGVVTRFNLQQYADAGEFAKHLAKFSPWLILDDFILSGDLTRAYNPNIGAWDPTSSCPPEVTSRLLERRTQINGVVGGFLWNLDLIFVPDKDGTHGKACPPDKPTVDPSMADYVSAILAGMQ